MGSNGGGAIDSCGGRVVGGVGVGAWVDVGDKEWEGFSGLGSECGKSVWQVGGGALTRGRADF